MFTDMYKHMTSGFQIQLKGRICTLLKGLSDQPAVTPRVLNPILPTISALRRPHSLGFPDYCVLIIHSRLKNVRHLSF